MSNPALNDAIDIQVTEVDANPSGDYDVTQISVRYRIRSLDEGILRLLNERQEVNMPLEDVPDSIRSAVMAYLHFARQRLHVPTQELLGKLVTASVDLRHGAYIIDDPSRNYHVKLLGYIQWGTRTRENLDQEFTFDNLTS